MSVVFCGREAFLVASVEECCEFVNSLGVTPVSRNAVANFGDDKGVENGIDLFVCFRIEL